MIGTDGPFRGAQKPACMVQTNRVQLVRTNEAGGTHRERLRSMNEIITADLTAATFPVGDASPIAEGARLHRREAAQTD